MTRTWAIKKYRGHRVLPESILKEFDDAHHYSTTATSLPSSNNNNFIAILSYS
ncbi:hypothetical protein BU15DRAFT_51688 [Melanogaster broomeanus]|nr:hypothetical protein BU15DRAFT_57446 [Melanogaster broomeanus]KAF9235168.1 hypothetical protein BU15DRAFT_51688 [Melanogaster broomeanus]